MKVVYTWASPNDLKWDLSYAAVFREASHWLVVMEF